MSWDNPGDSDDEPFLPPLPQEDRLWRHPSEVGTGPPPAAPADPSRQVSVWAVAAVAGLIGTVFSMGVITLIGGLEPRVVERQVIERVAIPPVAASGVSSGDGGVVEVADRISPAIARLEIATDDEIRSGSGVVFRSNGYLLTNAHVVEDARVVQVELANGSLYEAEVIGADPLTDIAVIKIDVDDVPTAVLGSEVVLRVGEPVIAIGSPAGLRGGPSVTTGVVSALGRRVIAPGEGSLHDMVQFDAPIAPGSSGGALVNSQGAVIGITTAIAVTEVGAEGLGFATPIDVARSVADDIIETGEAQHPLLGIEGTDLDMAAAAAQDLPGGALVLGIADGGPAAGAGLQPGDVITSLADQPTATMSALVVTLRSHEPGETVTITYRRAGEEVSATIDLGRR
jgi:S1-C subfamily serine protease